MWAALGWLVVGVGLFLAGIELLWWGWLFLDWIHCRWHWLHVSCAECDR